MNTNTKQGRQPASLEEVMHKIMNDPESRAAFMKAYRTYRLRQIAKRLVVAVALISIILTAVIFVACNSRQAEPDPTQMYTLVQTQIVTIQRAGTRTFIIENETARQHAFTLITTRHRGEAPPTETRTHINTDIVRIYSRAGVLVVYELQTGTIHIV